MKRLTVPRKIVFPYGYVIRIKQQERDTFRDEHGDAGLAFWEEGINGGTIYLDKSRPLRKRLEDLEHELGHGWIDWLEHYRDHILKRTSR